ncbi:MAG: hypothetical protein V5A64_06015 [Candidatus Thermoplasmatota archaeon]
MARRRRHKKIAKKVIRCRNQNKPVFEHEVCKEFSSNHGSDVKKNCKNCKHSF